MYILALKTDQQEAFVYLYEDKKEVYKYSWTAHRELSITLHTQIEKALDSQKLDYEDLGGIVIFKGPGSFTGLRIGITVANTLADGLSVPIVGTMSDNWMLSGIDKLMESEDDKLVMPEYGGEPNITQQKK